MPNVRKGAPELIEQSWETRRAAEGKVPSGRTRNAVRERGARHPGLQDALCV